ncbi:DNA polymerase III subunit delta' [Nanchangia anserum]|uniref:DNA polymerase III subunit delta n=1 Tax=Nanchangia anserum TaxID=2692125 RepID=A0A8I0GCV4_9ACTO|nr:DNA polymerase III subunit delta' [Nanchangia anserum]MBD3689666.1 DNA polymerase III subunit delta' [Nanchangia anserum]QOX81845.1 DNA polymerase III subunit delta' [Nanchangia anserum]
MTTVWSDVVDQPDAVTAFRSAAEDARGIVAGRAPLGHMTHAWLITGPPGSGRSTAARAFAAALQCDAQPPGCGHCTGCRTALAGSHADVTLVATERVIISIAEVAGLVTEAQQAPSQGRWRVIVVEDADRMVEQTSNLLLKAIEEPPPRTVWLLCTPSAADVLPTIRSRCRHVNLRVPAVSEVADLIVRRDGVDRDTAMAAAAMAQSHIGLARHLATSEEARARRRRLITRPATVRSVSDAVIVADDLVTTAKDDAREANERRSAEEKTELLRMLGYTEATRMPAHVRSQVRALEQNQERRATRLQRDALDRTLIDLLSLYRDVYVTQTGAGVDLVNVDLVDLVHSLAEESTPQLTVFRLDAIAAARRRLAHNVTPLLVMEAMTIALRPQQGAERRGR